MDGDNDKGYHSSDNNESERMEDVEENTIFQDLNYNAAETRLDEPNYPALKERRFKRNQKAMETLDAHIAHLMPFSEDPEIHTAEENAAVVIQKHVRGFLAQRQYVDLLMAQFEKEEKLRREKTIEQMEEAKLLIENHQLEVQFEEYNVVRRNKAQRIICYAITIQRVWRKYLAMKKAELYTEDKICGGRVNDDDELDLAAIQLTEHAIQAALSELVSG